VTTVVSWLMFGLVLGGYYEYGRTSKTHPLAPWHQVGSDSYAFVVNLSDTALPVGAIAPKVDRVIRLMGFAPPHDSVYLRIPYADTSILLLVGDAWIPLELKRPGIHRIEVRPIPRDRRG